MATTMADLDGVMNPWEPVFHPWLFRHSIVKALKVKYTPWKDWHHYRTYGIDDKTFVELLQEFAREGLFTSVAPFDGSAEAMKRLHDAGHTIHVVTDRPDFIVDDTKAWLENHGCPFDSVTISRDKTIFKQFGPEPYYAIDDRTENVRAMREAGISAFLLTSPWNVDADLPRVDSVGEYVNIVLEETCSKV